MKPNYPELYTRWFEYGAFPPIFRTHGSRLYNEVWTYGKAAEPILDKYLKYLKLHQLMPCIYSLGYRTYESGAPYLRAPIHGLPRRSGRGRHGRRVYVRSRASGGHSHGTGREQPRGLFAGRHGLDNYWTNQRIRGGQTIRVSVPIDTLPLFGRAGSITPLGEPVESTSGTQKLAHVRVYRGADGDFTLYDGKTYA